MDVNAAVSLHFVPMMYMHQFFVHVRPKIGLDITQVSTSLFHISQLFP
jgi:hypothetical protein